MTATVSTKGEETQIEGSELLRGTGDGCGERDSKKTPRPPDAARAAGTSGEAATAGPEARLPPCHAPQKQALVLSSLNPERPFAFPGFIVQ